MSCGSRLWVRHWFTLYGAPGVRAPTCQHVGCDAPNPRPLTDEELREFEGVIESRRRAAVPK